MAATVTEMATGANRAMAATPKPKEKTPALFAAAERQVLETLAKQRGFRTLREYLVTLAAQDATQHGIDVTVTPTEELDDLPDPVESFRRAWAQAQNGDLLTEDEFWQAVADDE